MASFKARIGWKWPRKKENKYCRSVLFQPNAKQKIPKKQQIKNKKIPLRHHFKPKSFGKCKERVKIKIIISFCPYLTHNLKFHKNCKKNQKIEKCQYGVI